MVESLGEGLLITDLDDVVQIVNARMLALTGFHRRRNGKGRRALNAMLPPEQWARGAQATRALVEGNRRAFRNPALAQGRKQLFGLRSMLLRCAIPPGGAVIGRLSVTNDISARKQDEERLKFLADVLSHVTEAIIAVDNENLVNYWNHGAEELYGFKFYEALNRPLRELIHDDWLAPSSPSENALEMRQCLARRECPPAQEWLPIGGRGLRSQASTALQASLAAISP